MKISKLQRDTTGIERILKNCYKKLYANKMDNLQKKNGKVLRYKFPILNQEETENIDGTITSSKIGTLIKHLLTK